MRGAVDVKPNHHLSLTFNTTRRGRPAGRQLHRQPAGHARCGMRSAREVFRLVLPVQLDDPAGELERAVQSHPPPLSDLFVVYNDLRIRAAALPAARGDSEADQSRGFLIARREPRRGGGTDSHGATEKRRRPAGHARLRRALKRATSPRKPFVIRSGLWRGCRSLQSPLSAFTGGRSRVTPGRYLRFSAPP